MTISSLADLIAQVESAGNQFACRIEPLYVPKGANVIKLAALAHISQSTAYALCKMSWGMFQEMGSNLIDAGLNVSTIEFASDTIMQIDYFDKYCTTNHIKFTLNDVINDEAKRNLFAHNYNGPGNVQVYSKRMLDIYEAHK